MLVKTIGKLGSCLSADADTSKKKKKEKRQTIYGYFPYKICFIIVDPIKNSKKKMLTWSHPYAESSNLTLKKGKAHYVHLSVEEGGGSVMLWAKALLGCGISSG